MAIPDSVFENLPTLLKNITDRLRLPHERSVFLAGALPVIGNALINVEGDIEPAPTALNLFAVISAAAGSGKGTLRLARQLGAQIDLRYRNTGSDSNDDVDDGDSEDPDEEVSPTFFVAANATSAGLIDALKVNKGRGVMFVSELRVLLRTGRSGTGDILDILLQSFHQEPVSVLRKRRDVNIPNPALSLVASGTPEDLKQFIPSLTDGFLSRLMLEHFEAPPVWLPLKPTSAGRELRAAVSRSADILDKINIALGQRDSGTPIIVELTSEQWDTLDTAFRDEFQRNNSTGTPVLTPSVKRSANISFRIACIFAALDAHERGEDLSKIEILTANDAHLDAAVALGLHYLENSRWIIASRTKELPSKAETKRQLFEQLLPTGEFTTAIGLDVGRRVGVSVRTSKEWLKQLSTVGFLIPKSHGHYLRPGTE